jgi:hypothetical protein
VDVEGDTHFLCEVVALSHEDLSDHPQLPEVERLPWPPMAACCPAQVLFQPAPGTGVKNCGESALLIPLVGNGGRLSFWMVCGKGRDERL